MESDSRKIIERLEAGGWTLVRTRGSHHHFKHLGVPEIIAVKLPEKDLAPGLVADIHKKAGWR